MKPSLLRRIAVLPVLLILTLSLTCCSRTGAEFRDYTYFAMDTVVTLRLAQGGLSPDTLAETADSCASLLAKLESELSSHNPASPVYRLNHGESAELPPSAASVLETALSVSNLSDGAYDCTLGPLIELWNVTGGGPVPSPDAIAEAMAHTGADRFRFDGSFAEPLEPGVSLDLGGVGKGYAAEAIADLLSESEVPYGLVSLGGNIGIFGTREDGSPYKIGVRDPAKPEDPSAVIGYLYLTEGFVSVSGDYERYFEENGRRYHHILDPKTGYPADSGLHSTAVWSRDGAAADALSTALFVLGEDGALALYRELRNDDETSFEAVLVADGGRIVVTDGLKDRFTLTNDNYTLAE